MSDIQTEKNFQAKIPIHIWEQWETWLDGRGTLNNTQIFCGFLRLFLASPESLQLKALFGRAEDLEVVERPADDSLTAEECEEIRQILRSNLAARGPLSESTLPTADQVVADAAARAAVLAQTEAPRDAAASRSRRQPRRKTG